VPRRSARRRARKGQSVAAGQRAQGSTMAACARRQSR
jgi:hypothetical protein